MQRLWNRFGLYTVLLGVLTNAGCGKSKYQTTPVRGVVVCKGTPVREGNLSFSPIPKPGESVPGKTAVAVVQEDGSFQLATYSQADGAIIGRHRVMYAIPDPKPGQTPCGIMVVQEIEITAGMGELTIELGQTPKR